MARAGVPVSADLPDDLKYWKQEIRNLWIRVWVAANKVAALLVAVALHKALDVSAEWVVPVGWPKWLFVLRVTFAAAFSVVYLHFIWEVLTVFIPSIRVRNRNADGGTNNASDTERSR